MKRTFRDIVCRYSDICVERGYRNGIYNDYWMGKTAAVEEIIGALNNRDMWNVKNRNCRRDALIAEDAARAKED